jgi:uroporphyrin-III C-methyltransferase / precorrin-2 dehydrogenase / sirohydrochlorin ferrochelatase
MSEPRRVNPPRPYPARPRRGDLSRVAGGADFAHFPIFLNLAGKRVVVIGGGEEAAAKARLLAPTGAELHVFTEQPCAELLARANAGAVTLHRRVLGVTDLRGARLAVVALDGRGEAERACALAGEAGVLVNAVDRPELCDFIVPALLERTPVTSAIGTDGAAPALAGDLRARV